MRRIFALLLAAALLCAPALAEYDFSDVFNQPAVADAVHVEGTWENILLLGGDSRDPGSYGRTDTMMILSINREEALVKMTSIMRDTWVSIPGHRNAKINAANVYGGPELAVETVNLNFGADIEDYVIICMDDLSVMVDMLGGVDVELGEAEAAELGLSGAGWRRLDGEKALAFSRIRSIDSDYQRVRRQQRVLLAMARAAQDMELDELMDVAGDFYEIITTSLEKSELEDFATAFMVMEVEDVERSRMPFDGAFDSGTYDGIWMIRPDLKANSRMLKEFIYD